ncbi:MAG TPA: hypothetical protein VKU82_09800 [Planctomycetaceae bacterium]|nr:hypothetical protein [Planctomycetaceae bacterium]
MMARLYWNSAVPSWIDCFDRFSAAWLMAIVFVLCGCQFYPPPAPHVRVDVSQRAPRMEPSRPVEPLRAPEPRPIAPDPRDPFESNKIEPEAPARDDATDRLAAEPEPIAFAQQGPAAALPHVFGPFEMGAALTTNDIFSSQGREVPPLEALPGEIAKDRPNDDGFVASNSIAALPPSASVPNWQPLGAPAAPRHLPDSTAAVVRADDFDDESPREAEMPKKKPRGFPWITIVMLGCVAAAVTYQYYRKGIDGIKVAAKKTAPARTPEPGPGAALGAPAAPIADLNPVGAASGSSAG